MALDLFGPASAPGAVTARPSDGRSFTGTDSWFADCSTPEAEDGTEFQAAWFNQLMANARVLARGNGNTAAAAEVVTQDNADDSMLLKSTQHLIQRGKTSYAADSGSANAIAISLTPAPAELLSGLVVRGKKSANANTGATTLTLNAFPAKALKRADGTDLRNGDLPANYPFEAIYDLTLDIFVLVNFYGNYVANGPFSSMNTFLHSSGALVCPHATYTKCPLNSATIGANNDVSLVSNSCRINNAGRYLIFTSNVFGVVTGTYSVFSMFPAAIFKNGSILQNSSGFSGETTLKIKEVGGAGTIVADLAALDVIDMHVYQASAASASATGTSGGQLSITRVR